MTRPPGYGLDPDSPCDEIIDYKVAGSRSVTSAQFRVTHVSGEAGKRLEERQNKVILELLQWAAEHRAELEAVRKPGACRVTEAE